MADPVRIQRRRVKGWRMPPNTVTVSRPSIFGNPFRPEDAYAAGHTGSLHHMRGWCVTRFRDWLAGREFNMGEEIEAARTAIIGRLPYLRGKNLACWCPLDQPCHADILLELANRLEAA